VLIVEATFGIRTHEARDAREARLLSVVHRVVKRGGHVLMPLSAFGRAQELMLMIDEYWAANPELHGIPVYYAAPSAIKALQLYRAFTSYMTRGLQARMGSRNPWDFRHIRPLANARTLSDAQACVVIAAPGMLQGGVSRALFERWCENPLDAVVVAGYCVEGTLAKDILRNPREVTASSGRKLALNCDVEEVQFAAHADYAQTSALVDALAPEAIVLVHGEATEMRRLHQALAKKRRAAEGSTLQGVYMPKNQSAVRRLFRQDRSAKAVGLLAERDLSAGRPAAGVLVRRAFSLTLVDESEVSAFTPLRRTRVDQRMHVPFRAPWTVARHFVLSVFDDVVDVAPADAPADGTPPPGCLLVSGVVRVTRLPPGRVRLEWRLSPAADVVADALVAVLAQAEFSPMALSTTLVECCPPAPPVAEAEVAAALGRAGAPHRFCAPGCEPGAAGSSDAAMAAGLPPHLSAVLGDVEVAPAGRGGGAGGGGGSEAGGTAEAGTPLNDPVASPGRAEAARPLAAWRSARSEEARRRAGAMLAGVLQEWFGRDAVRSEGGTLTVVCAGEDAAVDLASLRLAPADVKASQPASGLRESVRLAIAHCREATLAVV